MFYDCWFHIFLTNWLTNWLIAWLDVHVVLATSLMTTWWRTRLYRVTVRFCGCIRRWSRPTARSTSSTFRSIHSTVTSSSFRGRTTANSSISSTTTRWILLYTTPPTIRSGQVRYACQVRYAPSGQVGFAYIFIELYVRPTVVPLLSLWF